MSGLREALEPLLDDGLEVDLLYGRSDLPVNDEARVAVDDRAPVVEGSPGVDIGNVDAPVLGGRFG